MIAGLKLREKDAEQPLLGPRMLSMRVNVLKCEKLLKQQVCQFSDNFWILKLNIHMKFLTAYVNIFYSNWIFFFSNW